MQQAVAKLLYCLSRDPGDCSTCSPKCCLYNHIMWQKSLYRISLVHLTSNVEQDNIFRQLDNKMPKFEAPYQPNRPQLLEAKQNNIWPSLYNTRKLTGEMCFLGFWKVATLSFYFPLGSYSLWSKIILRC